MTKTTGALIGAFIVCDITLAVIGGKSYAENKQKNAETTVKNITSQTENQPKTENSAADKISLVLSKMSRRAQSEITITDTDAFLADLTKVLAFDAQSPSDDLPLYTLVDKQHYLPAGYAPKRLISLVKNSDFTINRNDLSLRPEAEKALHIMAEAAKKDGISILVSSSYRSFEYQKIVYDKWVRIDGQEEADRESARPGTSQHQLGTAVDFGSISDNFAKTNSGAWMYKNAALYGWSLSFPKGYEDITGYRWECWHFRYIGKEACAFQKKYFNDIQQYMFEFINTWKAETAAN